MTNFFVDIRSEVGVVLILKSAKIGRVIFIETKTKEENLKISSNFRKFILFSVKPNTQIFMEINLNQSSRGGDLFVSLGPLIRTCMFVGISFNLRNKHYVRFKLSIINSQIQKPICLNDCFTLSLIRISLFCESFQNISGTNGQSAI